MNGQIRRELDQNSAKLRQRAAARNALDILDPSLAEFSDTGGGSQHAPHPLWIEMKTPRFALALTLALAPVTHAIAQAPEIIRYTFDQGNAANSAVPGVGDGTVITGVAFTAGGLCPGGGDTAAESLTGSLIDTGWINDLGGGDWTIGMWLDLRLGGINFQYAFGETGGSTLRCFLGTGGSVFLSATGMPSATIVGAATTAAPQHLVWCHDSAAQELRGYRNGALAVTTPLTSPLNLAAGANPFRVMGQTNSLTAMNRMDDFRIYRRCVTQGEIDTWMQACGNAGGLGSPYCGPAVMNTSGSSAVLSASGSTVAANNNLALNAFGMPANVFGFFLTSQTQSFTANPGGSTGNLCLGGTIGRYVGPGLIQNSGAAGAFGLSLDLTQTPAGPIFVSIAAGETWNFQAWFRDTLPGGAPGSNFTDGLSIDFN